MTSSPNTLEDEAGRVGKPTRLSSTTEPQEGLRPTGFDPSRMEAGEIIATHSFNRAMAGDGVAALMAAGVTARRKLKGERDTEFVKRIGRAYLDACRTLTIIEALSAIKGAREGDAS